MLYTLHFLFKKMLSLNSLWLLCFSIQTIKMNEKYQKKKRNEKYQRIIKDIVKPITWVGDTDKKWISRTHVWGATDQKRDKLLFTWVGVTKNVFSIVVAFVV
jgi:hypothetical protein